MTCMVDSFSNILLLLLTRVNTSDVTNNLLHISFLGLPLLLNCYWLGSGSTGLYSLHSGGRGRQTLVRTDRATERNPVLQNQIHR